MNQTSTKFKWDAHKIVMIVRLSVESLFFLLFIIGSSFIPWLEKIPSLFNLQLGIVCAWIFSIFFLVWVIKRESRHQSIQDITYYESIGDAFLIIWLTFVFGGPNGPLFFIYFLMIMEAAFTLNSRVILVVALSAIAALIVDFVIGVVRYAPEFNAASLFLFTFRLVAVFLISYYGYSLAKSILREHKTAADLNVASIQIRKLFQVKNEFLNLISHQLRTPLTALKGLISLWIEDDYETQSQAEQTKIKERIKLSIDRLSDITNAMLDTLNLERGRVKFQFEDFDLIKIIQDTIAVLKPNFEKKGLYLKFLPPKEKIPLVRADAKYLSQAFQNLIDNAEKYTEQGGLTIKLNMPDIKHIQLSFQDTGIGLEKEEQKYVFQEKFFRGKGGKEKYTGGTGLGLYLVKQIIDAHQGKIIVKSEGLNEGTEIIITIPIYQ